MSFPVQEIRRQFPALKRRINNHQVVVLDGPSGTQMAQSTIDAMIEYMCNGNANLGGQYPTAIETEQSMSNTRKAMADLLGGLPREIAFGMNMTSLAFDLSRALSRNWTSEDNIVVTELDHRANVDTWITAARDQGTEIRWLRMDPQKLILDLSSLDKLVDHKTKLVAIGHASNGIGTINDVPRVSSVAKKNDAIVVVDAVHSAPHLFIDRDSLGADIIMCSAYKFFGPHIGIASIKESIFESLNPYKITTSPSHMPDKLETGTQSFESLAGVRGAVDFIASLGTGSSRRERIKRAFGKIHPYETDLASFIREFLNQNNNITLYQAPSDVPKTPTIAFRVINQHPTKVCEYLATKGIYSGDGHFYAKTIGDVLDLNSSGGWIRIGIAPYNTEEEVQFFVQTLKEYLSHI